LTFTGKGGIEGVMEISLATPALLFPTVSLLMLAYTNRFLGLAGIIRKLHAAHLEAPNPGYVAQISNMRTRVRLIRDMQFCGVFCMLLSTGCIFAIFLGMNIVGNYLFGAALVFLLLSMLLSLIEIGMSVSALDLHLQDIEHPAKADVK